MVLFIIIIALAASFGCAGKTGPKTKPHKKPGLGPQKFMDEYTHYYTGPLPAGWKRLWGYDADLAYFNKAHGAVIMVNSTCDVTKTVPIVALRNHLLIDLTERHIVSQKEVLLDMRRALHTTVQGRLDGALVKIEMYVVQVDSCIYDFAYIVSLENYEALKEDFRKFVNPFHAKRKR